MIAFLAGIGFYFVSIPLAVATWRLPSGTWAEWPVRLAAIPLILLTEWLLLQLLRWAMQDDGDEMAGWGFMYAPGMLITAVTVIAYAAALAIAALRLVRPASPREASRD